MTRSKLRFVAGGCLSLVVFGLLAACASPSEHPAPAEEGTNDPFPPLPPPELDGGQDGALNEGGSGGDAGAVCQKGTQLAPPVEQQIVAGPKPVPTGGTIVQGTYLLTAMNYYGGTPGPAGVQGDYTLVISGGEIVITGDRVAGMLSAPAKALTATMTYSTAGDVLFPSVVCPPSYFYPSMVSYSATPTTLTIFKNPMDLEVFTKQ